MKKYKWIIILANLVILLIVSDFPHVCFVV